MAHLVNLVSKDDPNAAFVIAGMGMQDCFVIRPNVRTLTDFNLEYLADYFFERVIEIEAAGNEDIAFTTDIWFTIDRRDLDELTEIADEGYVIGYDRDFTYNPSDYGIRVF